MAMRAMGQRRVAGLLDAGASALGALDVAGDLTMGAGAQLFIDDGSLSAPGLALRTDIDTGISYASGVMTLGYGGVSRVAMGAVSTSVLNGIAEVVTLGLLASAQAITAASDPISSAVTYRKIDPDGTYTNTANPAIGNPSPSSVENLLLVHNVDSALTYTIPGDGSTGVWGIGGLPIALPPGGMALLIYDGTDWRQLTAVADT